MRHQLVALGWIVLCNLLSAPLVSCLYCVQCNSELDPGCRQAYVEPTECSPEALGCMTYIGKMAPPVPDFVIRSCTNKKQGTFCMPLPGHEFCVSDCFTDSCNDRPHKSPSHHHVLETRPSFSLNDVTYNAKRSTLTSYLLSRAFNNRK